MAHEIVIQLLGWCNDQIAMGKLGWQEPPPLPAQPTPAQLLTHKAGRQIVTTGPTTVAMVAQRQGIVNAAIAALQAPPPKAKVAHKD